MKIFYFTATGNSLAVAKKFDSQIYSIPQMIKEEQVLYEDDAIGFIFPCYVGSIPTVIEEFIKDNKFKAEYIFAIMTYGNISMGALNQFTRLANTYDIEVDYVNEIKMVDTSLKYYDMKTQIENLASKNVDMHIEKIINEIVIRKSNNPTSNVIVNQISKVTHRLYRREIGSCDNLFSVEKNCNGCKVCVKVCPVDNIVYKSNVEFKHECIRCYACTQNCPQNAIRFKGEKSRERYRNEEVTLKEIIDSNL